MRSQEQIIGDYISLEDNCLGFNSGTRHHLITLLEDLNIKKGYKEETLYLAANICDRFLINLLIRKEQASNLVLLVVVSTLIAAKVEEPFQPTFKMMLNLVD